MTIKKVRSFYKLEASDLLLYAFDMNHNAAATLMACLPIISSPCSLK